MSGYQPGEIVDITIKGARVSKLHESTEDAPEMTVYLESDCGSMPIRVPHGWPMVIVKRVAPAEWPPRPGDLWRRDGVGDVWFAVLDNYGGKLVMLPANPTKGLTAYEPDRVLTDGPLTLVHREDAGGAR